MGKRTRPFRKSWNETYGPQKAEAIETVLRIIRMGNLAGNTGDYLLYRFSFGRWGLTEDDG